MKGIAVLTIRHTASKLNVSRTIVPVMLAAGELTPATVNGRPAVLDDLALRRAIRRAQKVAA